METTDISHEFNAKPYLAGANDKNMKNVVNSVRSITRRKKALLPAAILIIFLVLTFAVLRNIVSKPAAVATTSDNRYQVEGPTASVELNREFKFPLRDSKNKEVTKISYLIENAELRNQIIVQGRPATAIEGKTFLILTIKIKNDYTQSININARDYLRIVVNNKNDELLAADIHNDPVNVQPISTKVTRVGFPINDSDKDIKLLVGEIKDKKTEIPLNF